MTKLFKLDALGCVDSLRQGRRMAQCGKGPGKAACFGVLVSTLWASKKVPSCAILGPGFGVLKLLKVEGQFLSSRT